MQRNPLKFKALRLIIKEGGGIELLKELHVMHLSIETPWFLKFYISSFFKPK